MHAKSGLIHSSRYILYALAVLPVFIFRDFTPDNELRYLSIADEALRNGSVFTFTNHGIPYADKPPLYLWIVMLGKMLFGYHNLLFLGLFSYLPALVILYVMDQWVKNILRESKRLTGQLMLLTSGYFIGTAVVLRMDMLMCMFIVLALYTFFRMYSGEGKPRDQLLFPFFVFMAIFSKGPVGIVVPLLSTLVFLFIQRELKSTGKYWGWKTLAVLITLFGVWFAGVYTEGGSSYLNNLLFNQTVSRAVNSAHHQEPFYFYLLTIWYSLAPWSLLVIGILAAGIKKKLTTTAQERFFLVIILSTGISLSLFSSKLAVYLLPAFPFSIYLAVRWLSTLGSPKWILVLAGVPAGLLCLTLPAVILAPQLIDSIEAPKSVFIYVAAVILFISGISGFMYLNNNNIKQGIIRMGAGMLLSVFAVSFAIPHYNPTIGLRDLCDHAQKYAAQKGVANYYYCEMSRGDNMDIYLGVKPEKLTMADLYKTESPIDRPAILFLWQKAIDRNDSLQRFIEGKARYQSGKYYCIELE